MVRHNRWADQGHVFRPDATGAISGFQTPLDQQIRTNTIWFDQAQKWLAYVKQVPSAAASLNMPAIYAGMSAFKDAAGTDAGSPDFAVKWQTATQAINTMVTANGWTYGPATNDTSAGPVTLPTITVRPNPSELARSQVSNGTPPPDYSLLGDMRALGNTLSSGLASADHGIAKVNGIVNDELVDEGAQELRNGNKAGFIWNGIKYSFYNTFMPGSVEQAAVGVAGGAVAGKVLSLGLKAVAPLFARGLSKAGTEALNKAGFKSVQEFAQAAGEKYQQFYNEGYSAGQLALEDGTLRVSPGIPTKTVLGQYTDQYARYRMLAWLKNQGIAEGPGEVIQINRYLYDPNGSGAYRIPDVYVPRANVIYDGTIGTKTWSSPQIRGFYQYSGGADIIVVRPSEMGGARRIESRR